MPAVQGGEVEGRLLPRDLGGIREDGVLVARCPGLGVSEEWALGDRLDQVEKLLRGFVDDSDLGSDADTVPDWEELANATDPDDPSDFPVPEPGFLAQLVIGGAILLALVRLRGRSERRSGHSA